MRAVLAVLLLLASVLAGCASDDDPDPDTGSGGNDDADQAAGGDAGSDAGADGAGGSGDNGASGDGDDTPTGGSDASTDQGGDGDGPATNTPPVVDLLADTLSADVPFNVTFTFEGSDADGDELSWTFDADGDGAAETEGTGLPFNFTYSYTEAGNFTAMLEVTDGEATVNDTVMVEAVAAAAPAGDVFPLALDIEVAEGCTHCYQVGGATGGADGCLGYQFSQNNLDCGWVEIPPEASGRAFTADGPSDADLVFYTACSGGDALAIFDNDGNEAGAVPDGAGCIVAWDFVSGGTIAVVIS